MRRLGQAQRRPNNRIGWGVAFFIAGSAPLLADDRIVADRLVQTFQEYCVGTLGNPAEIAARLPRRGWIEQPSGPSVNVFGTDEKSRRVIVTDHHTWVEVTDRALHRLHIEVWNGVNHPDRYCVVGVPFADKAAILRALARDLALAEATLLAASEPPVREIEATWWKTRLGDAEATVELRAPIHADVPGYSLSLWTQK